METELDKLIYDWNRDGRAARADYRAVELDDETLRDGLQGPSVRNPPLDVKRRLLQLMDQLGIDSADLGLPGASPQARATIVALAKRICVSDTCGHATPEGVRNLLAFVRDEVVRGRAVKIDFHGHNDRGLGTINALTATALADRVHGCALGIGERVGNSSMDQLLVNLLLWGLIDRDLTPLVEYTALVAEHCGIPIPPNYPAMGSDAFRTGTGVHAAAVIKALRKGDRALADRVYSAVPASVLGREQRIEVGPMSGESNVVYWLESRGIEATRERVDRIFADAKVSDRLLNEEELAKLALP